VERHYLQHDRALPNAGATVTRIPPRILIVEGEPVIRLAIEDMLVEAGYEVLAASDGSKALELLDEPDDVDLVVTAIVLAGADGIEIAWRARTGGQAVPVVFASGHGDRLATATSPAPNRRIAKPYTMEVLRAAVEELLEQREGEAR
jgi:DNA-binding response OmpR family regulator